MKVYEIKQELVTLRDLAENENYDTETGEIIDATEEIKQLFNEVSLILGDKLDGCAYIIDELTNGANMLEQEAKRLNTRAKHLKNNVNSLKELMLSAVKELPEMKLKTAKFSFSTRKSESVTILEDFNMNGKYVRVKEVREPDKKLIKETIKNGEHVLGAELSQNISLTIK